MEKLKQFLKNIGSAMARIVAISVVVLALAAVYNVAISITPETYDPGVLLTAAALSLFSLAFLVSILALFGWRELNSRIKATVQAQLKDAHEEYRGWVRLTTGLFYGRICRTIDKGSIKIERMDLLELAITNTQNALVILKDTPKKWTAINNLTFYLALQAAPRNGPTAKNMAEKLLEKHSLANEPEFLNTYAKVVATYSTYFEKPQNTLRQARDMLQEIITTDIKKSDKDNALLHLRALDKALSTKE